MSEHPIKGLMTTAMENLKEMIDVNTIVGDPVETPDGGVILTVSKVGFGFAMGGSEFNGGGSNDQQDQGGELPFGGGSGGGVSITPIAFLVVNKEGVNMLHLEQNTHLIEKLIDLAPGAVEKVQKMISNNNQLKNKHQQSTRDEKGLDFDI
ncbi:GerW family sporulation protein [Lederbergia lenta]|uniref:Sporulation protein YtfJ n=1 Tax=Lederbergia lenta TaxID=1467 RepID=A0A2X4VS53_LEDLE|nr:GerW family sporulation protein [Lederbergia lenta]MCM3111104.1 GerW family sporulation protein [Lederbergia lenta]MEC2325508.1 GerW family sporulation protein [Lederbergia lenta]SQI54936.1 sporulation protein YtfJ [Lederbergia lenta]